jgi:beta-glucanase (GH16 family)
LGGCDPVFSFKLQSCVPAPICQSKTHTFGGLKNVVDKTKYLGDASKADWVADGNPMNQGSNLLLTMEPHTVGTVLASTAYVWYGKISAVLKTSRGQGVVSAFILLSDVKDEIDFEWIGVDLDTTQTNYYWQGFPDC